MQLSGDKLNNNKLHNMGQHSYDQKLASDALIQYVRYCARIIYLNKVFEKVGLIFVKEKNLFHSGSLKPLSLFHLSKGKKN
jgi:hypothetical protein